MSDHETFCIHDDIFDMIKPTCKDKNIMLKFIPNEPNGNEFLSVATYMCCDKSQKKKRTISKKSTKHNIHRRRHKMSVGYRNKLFDDFILMIVDPSLKLDGKE